MVAQQTVRDVVDDTRVPATTRQRAMTSGAADRLGKPRGKLVVFTLGAAPGVGKTYAMLAEGQRRRARGTDVAAALVETHGRRPTAAMAEGLETVPRRTMPYRGATSPRWTWTRCSPGTRRSRW